MTEWGKPIEVNGKRPAWLGDDEIITVKWHNFDGGWSSLVNGECCAADFGRPEERGWIAFKLPSDHWAYKAIDLGFEPWGGGDSAPDDWDGGDVLRRSSGVLLNNEMTRIGKFGSNQRWTWADGELRYNDIIGYRKKENTMTNTPAEWAIERARVLYMAEQGLVESDGVSGTKAISEKAGERYSCWENSVIALARYIEQHEEAPIDPDLEIALEAVEAMYDAPVSSWVGEDSNIDAALRAIKLARERGKL